MIAKETRADRWAVVVGLLVLALRLQSAITTDLHTQSVTALAYNFDADFSAVTAGHISTGAAYLWATFFSDLTLYLLVGIGGAIFGAGLIASEASSGSIYVLLSRPMSRTRILLTKYGVAAGLSLLLCMLFGAISFSVGAWQGVESPPLGGWALSVLLLWLGMLFVIGVAMLYSVLVPSALAAGVLAFFTVYVLDIAPVFHSGTGSNVQYFLGGPPWQLSAYWSSLGIYAGAESPVKSLVIATVAAGIPVALAVVLFVRKAY
ncbi:MAG TPA: ABC transporter permease subunit [Ktedonobacterales bacterium]|jgi:ABC-type transport system involved in multi-copper enzyme maturation permease subunit